MRPRTTLSLAVAAFALTVAAAPAARASTVSVRNGTFTGSDGDTRLRSVLSYKASPGEENELTLTTLNATSSNEAPFLVSDPGAPIQPGSGCTPVNTHVARCTASAASFPKCDVDVWSIGARVRLGDKADNLRATDANLDDNRFDGGPGADFIRGSGSYDTIVVDDAGGAPATDTVDGGGGGDAVSYARRRGAVRVNLSAATGGAGGKEDVLANIADVTGGRGNDVLIGNAFRNVLRGGRGKDRINGKARNDRIDGGSNADKLKGGAGRDWIRGGSGRDSLSGGSGRDKLFSRDRSRDRVDGGGGRDRCRADKRDLVSRVETVRR